MAGIFRSPQKPMSNQYETWSESPCYNVRNKLDLLMYRDRRGDVTHGERFSFDSRNDGNIQIQFVIFVTRTNLLANINYTHI